MKLFESLVLIVILLMIAAGFNSTYGQLRHDPGPFRNASKETKIKGMRTGGVAVIAAGTTVLSLSLHSIKKSRQAGAKPLDELHYREGRETISFMQGLGVFLGGLWTAGGTAMTIIANQKLYKMKNLSFKVASGETGIVYSF